VTLKPGETRTIQIPLKASQLAYWNVDQQAFVVEGAPVTLLVGESSADIRLTAKLDVQ